MAFERFDEDKIQSQLEKLGVAHGDILFISCNLLKLGIYETSIEVTVRKWIALLQSAVGNGGTLVIPTYTPTFWRFRKNPNIVFTGQSSTTSGALSQGFLRLPRHKRSRHPTHSIATIGQHASQLVANHHPSSMSYEVYDEVLKLGGKSIMMGTLGPGNAPYTYQLARHDLGIARSHPYAGLTQSYYIDDGGRKRLFTRDDFGGCVTGAGTAYDDLIENNAMVISDLGNGQAALVDGQRSYSVYSHLFRNLPKRTQCNDRSCATCFGNWRINGVDVIRFWPAKALDLATRMVRGNPLTRRPKIKG